MDTIVEVPPEDGVQDLNLVDTSGWASHNSQEMVNNNSTFLYIAVEYVKDEYKMESTVNLAQAQDSFADFEQHVSPLDPNMSSVARYSPVYSEPSTEFNPIVVHQLIQPDASQNELINTLSSNNTLETMPVLCNNDIREVVGSQFLHMVNTANGNLEHVQSSNNQNELQIVNHNDDQEVELLITDQETGISYSVVRSQEFLVERCLEDEQLLNSLTPDPLLDSDLLTLDENSLKTELSDDIVNSAVVSSYISNLTVNDLKNAIESSENQFKMETRKNRTNEVELEDQLLSRVYSIIDKPVPSRARATLPESYLVIGKVNEGIAVFAKKIIPKSTQFGPLTGIFKVITPDDMNNNLGELKYLVEGENGIIAKLDVSDENNSNWMSFVRKAQNYSEQNLVLSQEGKALYFTTTRNVLPKQELKVGYSVTYAAQHKLSVLVPPIEKLWPCFECTAEFATSEDLQKHLNIHDFDKNENTKPRRKTIKYNKRKPSIKNSSGALKCNDCDELFIQPGKFALRQHLIEKHLDSRLDLVEQYFTSVMNFKCEHCEAIFHSEALLRIHNYLHDVDSSDEQTHHICPTCHRKFPTQRQLVAHVATHALSTNGKVAQPESFKCSVCHKLFAMRERLRRHMLVHGSDDSKPLQCKTCNKRFLNNSALAGHLKTHFVGKKVFECPICKDSFDHVLKLKLHVPKHCENNLYSCPHCPKVFKKYSIIRKHIRAFHCDQKHGCPHCSKQFPTVDKLKMHLLRHSDHREFLCADCGKQFKRKDKLKEHCKRMHSEERENDVPRPPKPQPTQQVKKLSPKSEPTDFHRFIYKCHTCFIGFKRRGMLVNHLAKRHPDISPDSVPELNLPILLTTKDYYCQHCDKVYKSSSKRKAHILKNHPGAALPMSNRKQGTVQESTGLPNPTFSQTVGSVTTRPQNCKWCHKQYASKAKLLQHQRKKHGDQMVLENNDGQCKGDNEAKPLPAIDEIQVEGSFFKETYKESDDILNNEIANFSRQRENDQYCQLVAIAGNDNFDQADLNNPNSHLYRLLVTSDELPSMVPPR